MVADYYVSGTIQTDHQRQNSLSWVILLTLPLAVAVNNFDWIPNLVIPIYSGLFIFATLQGGWIGKILSNPILTTIGGMCYTIYLYHYLIISFVGKLTSKWFDGFGYEIYLLAQIIIHGTIIFVVSAVAFRYTERPFMQVSLKKMIAYFRQ